MGALTYNRVKIQFDDRTLQHLQIVIIQKLRRGESFLLTWQISLESGGGRSSAWIHPHIPLYFEFSGKPSSINPVWLAALSSSANSSRGLLVLGEESVHATR